MLSLLCIHFYILGFPCGSAGKESACNVGDLGLIPELERSPGEGKSYPLQYSGLGNFMDCIVHREAKSRAGLSDCRFHFHSAQFSSVTQSCPTLCDLMNHNTPGLPVHHQSLEFTQTHVHRVRDAIQLSHLLSSPSSPAPNPSQHQSFPVSQLFPSGGQSTGVSASASFPPKKSQG